MAPASPLDLPLHADLGVLAQCHRRFLRQAHQPAPQARRVPIHPGTSGNRSLRRGNQRRSQTLPMVGTPKPHPRRCQKREGKVRVDPLGMTAIMKSAPTPSDREVLTGVVERVTYQNAENGFCVLRVKARGHRELVTLVGHAAAISAGEWITASGSWVNDRTHGQQFKARFLTTSAPTSVEGVEKYLASGMIRGIGPVYAKKLLRAFADKVFDIIEAQPYRCGRWTASARYEPAASRLRGPSRRRSARSWSSCTAFTAMRADFSRHRRAGGSAVPRARQSEQDGDGTDAGDAASIQRRRDLDQIGADEIEAPEFAYQALGFPGRGSPALSGTRRELRPVA